MKRLSHKIALFGVVIGIFSLTSCSFLSPVNTKPQAAYEIDKLPAVAKKKRHPITILVSLPDQVTAYNTTEMAYSIRPYEIAYYGQSRWAETPGQMLLPLIAQTLQNTNYFRAVLTPPFGGQYDYHLMTQILKLEQDFTRQPAALIFVVRVQLNKTSINQIVATKEFQLSQPMFRNDAYAGVIAANLATETVLRNIAEFTTKNAH